MAYISRGNSKILIGQGSAWGTARDLTGAAVGTLLQARLSFSAAFSEYQPRDIGFGNFLTNVVNQSLSVQVTMTGDLSYNNVWPQILANVMGTATGSPAEVTSGQGDYLHNLDVASDNVGRFSTLAWLVEDDYALECPSVKWNSFSMQAGVNEVGTWSATGIANRVVGEAAATNNAADIIADAYEGAFAGAPLGAFSGANHYFRLNAQGGAGLASGDNKEIQSYTFSISRPLDPLHVLQGGNSAFTNEPRHNGLIQGTFGFRFWKIDDAVRDWFLDWLNKTELKGELFFDGDLIGSGTRRSFKLQLPRMSPAGTVPAGYDLPDTSFAAPEMTYNLMQAAAAPTGMTGVQNVARMAVTNTRSVSYFN